ncbi:rCG49458 [Rattus norvegicus]|uniref:RCG49458 n=1 Tax=Rattus norvegicus TaxID=10116 RepID=A6J2I0_RAT|nr:rCG49458 [Rattus norvegicus]
MVVGNKESHCGLAPRHSHSSFPQEQIMFLKLSNRRETLLQA